MTEHANVVEALAAIMAELPAIAKTRHPSEGGKGISYAYRGVEEITAVAQQLFAKHGVVVVPQVRVREVKDIIVNGNPWTDTFLEVDWSVHGPGESVVQAVTFGQGRDNSDKGTNKAMTQAFKYLLLDMLMISDPGDDADGTNIEVDARDGGHQYSTPTKSAPEPEASPIGPARAARGGGEPTKNTKAMLGRIFAVSNQLGLQVADAIVAALGSDIAEANLTFAECRKVNDWLTEEEKRQA